MAAMLGLASIYLVAEVIGGWLTNSLALLADAGHMLSDVLGLGLGLFALWIADRPAGAHRTYGYYRAEILAALANAAALIVISVFIVIDAGRRLQDPPEVEGGLMMLIACGGLVVNLIGLAVLESGSHDNLNLRGAWLHVLSDALGSAGAIVAGGIIWLWGWRWADPAVSALIAVLITWSAWRLLTQAVSVLMENAPRGMNVDDVRAAMRSVSGVRGVHDLHIWTITSGFDALSAHVVADEQRPPADLLAELRDALHDRFGIDHLTIQIEPHGFVERPTAI
jgi:cobalt-zinc-cadmium efflux system protein